MPSTPRPHFLPDDLRQRLTAAHAALLQLHKTLLDHQRTTYERTHPPLNGPLDFLNAALHHPHFAHLRPVSELAVQIDELLSTKQPPPDPIPAAKALLAQTHHLITPNEQGDPFQRHFHHAIQQSPEVAQAHATWKRAATAEFAPPN